MDGDEMTRVIWQMIKDELICPFVDLKSEYYDLGLKHRNETDDQVTVDSAEATKKYGVAVKCATITPECSTYDRVQPQGNVEEPRNGTIQCHSGRAPYSVRRSSSRGVEPYVKNWVKPITIARHAYGMYIRASR